MSEAPATITIPYVQQQSNGAKDVVGYVKVNATLYGNSTNSLNIRPGATAYFYATDGSNASAPTPLTVTWQPTQGTDPSAGGELSGSNQSSGTVNQFGGPAGTIVVTGGIIPNNTNTNISFSPPKIGGDGLPIGGTNVNLPANASTTSFQIPVRATNNDQQPFQVKAPQSVLLQPANFFNGTFGFPPAYTPPASQKK